MSTHQGIPFGLAVLVLFACPAQAQQPTYETAFARNCRTTLVYMWPSEPHTYECCARTKPPQVLAPAAEGPASDEDQPESVVRFLADDAMFLEAAPQADCVDLSALTPLERLMRQTYATFGSCTRMVVYDHFPCTCENSCNNASFFCNCPGVPTGELPEIKPQDSLGSQPELVSETFTPCGSLSSCGGSPPGDEGPVIR